MVKKTQKQKIEKLTDGIRNYLTSRLIKYKNFIEMNRIPFYRKNKGREESYFIATYIFGAKSGRDLEELLENGFINTQLWDRYSISHDRNNFDSQHKFHVEIAKTIRMKTIPVLTKIFENPSIKRLRRELK